MVQRDTGRGGGGGWGGGEVFVSRPPLMTYGGNYAFHIWQRSSLGAEAGRWLRRWTSGRGSALRWKASGSYCFYVRLFMGCFRFKRFFAFVVRVPVLALLLPHVPAPSIQNADNIDQGIEVGVGIKQHVHLSPKSGYIRPRARSRMCMY